MHNLLSKVLIFLVILETNTFLLANKAPTKNSLEIGLEFYRARATNAKDLLASPEFIDKAISHFKQAKLQPALNKEASLLLMKSYYYKAVFTGLSEDKQKELFTEGRKLGEDMVKKHPNSPDFKYWLAIEWGKWATVYGTFAAAKEGVADILKNLCEDIIKLDPQFEYAAGHRILGRVHHQSPSIPFILGWPSNSEALKHLRKAHSYAPNHLGNRLFLAELLLDEGEEKEAKLLLEKIIGSSPQNSQLLEDRADILQAKKLLKTLKS